MSANTLVNIANACMFTPSIATGAPVNSGAVFGLSGPVIGLWVDMRNCDTFCHVYVAAGPTSGPIGVQVQAAPGPFDIPLANNSFSGNIFSGGAPLSGSFVDPTANYAQLPTAFVSGGILWVNSGLSTVPGQLGASGQQVVGFNQGTLPFGINPVYQGQNGPCFTGSGSTPEFASGGIAFAGFQRPYQYLRAILLSGATQLNSLQVGFISQLMTTGSGGGFTAGPLTSFVNV